MRGLVVAIEALKSSHISGDALDIHALSHGAPEIEEGLPFPLQHGPPAEVVEPARRFVDKGGEYIEKIVVGDGEPPMQPVHAAQRGASPLTS